MQTTDTLLMIEPVAFGFNAQTAENNYFQTNAQDHQTQARALAEFRGFVARLEAKDIRVIVVPDTPNPHTPDSIFPNNWVSFNQDGSVFLYPMFAPNRRDERRPEVLEAVRRAGHRIEKVEDLSATEAEGRFMEGTGSIIFDHNEKIAYGSVSLRLDEALFREFCKKIGYRAVVFHSYQSVGEARLPIYHTNVMMCVAEKFVVICLDTIDDAEERKAVAEIIRSSGKEIIEITEAQMQQFAGNMLAVRNIHGQPFLVMSDTAFNSLTEDQLKRIGQYTEIIHANLSTIEQNGGGSARCMLAEVFTPRS